MLRKSYDYHFRFDCSDFTDDLYPWGRLKEDPRWISFCSRMQTDMDTQAGRIREILAQHDIDELLAPLMALAEPVPVGE